MIVIIILSILIAWYCNRDYFLLKRLYGYYEKIFYKIPIATPLLRYASGRWIILGLMPVLIVTLGHIVLSITIPGANILLSILMLVLGTELPLRNKSGEVVPALSGDSPSGICLLVQVNSGLAAILFCFIMAGVPGVFLYRWLTIFQNATQARASILAIIDWVPARVLSLTYVLLGNFSKAYPVWKNYWLKGPSYNNQLLTQSARYGLEALQESNQKNIQDEPLLALIILQRTLLSWGALLGICAFI